MARRTINCCRPDAVSRALREPRGVTVQLMFEHNQFLHRLRALSYRLGEEARVPAQGHRCGARALLAEVPGLTAELSGKANHPKRTHLRSSFRLLNSHCCPSNWRSRRTAFPAPGSS
jgi:hypothetical protein